MRAAALLVAIALGGCTALPFGAGYTHDSARFGDRLPDAAETLTPGRDTDREVLAALGPPARLTRLADGYAFLYEGGDLDARSVGASVYQLRGAYAWSDRSFQVAAFVFAPNGRLTGVAIERSDAGTGRGFSIGTQNAKAADQFVFLLPASQHFWGRSMLRRTPRLLTEQTSLTSGEAGVERRGTTTKVGQNTLNSGYITALALLELLRTETGQ